MAYIIIQYIKRSAKFDFEIWNGFTKKNERNIFLKSSYFYNFAGPVA